MCICMHGHHKFSKCSCIKLMKCFWKDASNCHVLLVPSTEYCAPKGHNPVHVYSDLSSH